MFLSLVHKHSPKKVGFPTFSDLGEFPAFSNPHSFKPPCFGEGPTLTRKLPFMALTQDLLLRRANEGEEEKVPSLPGSGSVEGTSKQAPWMQPLPGPGNRVSPSLFPPKSLQVPFWNSHVSPWQEVLHLSLVLSIHPFGKYLLSTDYVQVLCKVFILYRDLELTLWWI